MYSLQHCVRSIRSTEAGVSRHRLTMADAQMPWEFRFNIYVFLAGLEDCTITEVTNDPIPTIDPYAQEAQLLQTEQEQYQYQQNY